jgi:hypothetical protein
MKKILISFSLLVVLGFVTWSCSRSTSVMPNGVANPIPTATPVCAFTPLPSFSGLGLSVGTFVIQNQTQWTSVNSPYLGPLSVPTGVNFANQMILEVDQFVGWDCNCSPVPPTITSVCVYSTYIQVEYQNGGSTCPTTIPGGPICNSYIQTNISGLAVVPLSNLPVVWVVQP